MGKPSFFKVLVGDFENKLQVPPAFLKHFNGVSPNVTSIAVDNGGLWVVIMTKKQNGRLFFSHGWGDFVQANSLAFEDLLMFKYHGNAHFTVKMYEKTACEKQPNVSTTTSKKKKKNPNSNGVEEKSIELVVEDYDEREKKKKHTSRPFHVTMAPSYVNPRDSYCHFPRGFAEAAVRNPEKDVLLTTDVGGSSKTCMVKYNKNGNRLLRGWRGFVKDNKLKVGDTCVFEAMEDMPNTVKVTISRKKQEFQTTTMSKY